ncbi:hypothetical protein F544_5650 [Bibersteinia trehalosi USDA-ARS-USMARC-190]|uniref:Uncharacterized protein n=1 Tax=Bibersteinia trehalosi USDA-ARS-USMARC-190 TaxID=1263832 RepID=W0R5S0_BIBTR|nr:hypothetical protein F544_5650 [Bibersteinia trehalosi USDA-ARS-USMARC-190]
MKKYITLVAFLGGFLFVIILFVILTIPTAYLEKKIPY